MLPKRNRPARKGGEANPFASLRKQLTLVCVAATSLILCLMAAVSLFISERDFVESERTAFESRVGGVVLYLQSNEVLDWTYLARSEAGGRILLYLEDNGAPMLFRGGWMPRSEREALFGHVKESAFYRQVAGDWQGEGAGGQVRSAYARLEEFPGLGGEEQAYHLSMYEIPGGKGSKLLVALGDTRAEQVAVRRRRLVFGVTTLAAVVLLALFSWWFSGRVIAPVDRSRRQQTEFVAAASHELRTPLAAIRAGVAALRIAEDEENRERFSSIIDKESARASHLVEDLLMLASIDAKGWSITRGPVEPDELLRDAVAPFQPLAAEKEIGLELLLPARPLPLLTGDAARLEQVMGILLSNALQYTPAGGHVEVEAQIAAPLLHILVRDSGVGMSDEQKASAFQRFYRADKARTGESNNGEAHYGGANYAGANYGLGLSIAWEIVRLHRGRLRLEDTPGGGLTARISLNWEQ